MRRVPGAVGEHFCHAVDVAADDPAAGRQAQGAQGAVAGQANLGARTIGANSQVTAAEARGFEPRMGANPNRISSAAP